MNILKIKKPFLITEAIAKSSSSCIQNLSKFIHSLSLDVLRVSLYQRSKRIMQEIPWTDHWSLYWNAKWHQWSSRSALYFRFTEFRFKINLGSFGPLTKYLKLSKVTNFLWLGLYAAQKIVFHNLRY